MQNTILKGCIFTIAFLVSSFCAATKYDQAGHIKTSVLFVAYSEQEAKAFLKIQKQLRAAKVTYRVITMGKAVKFFRHNPALIDEGALTHNDPISSNRYQLINHKLVYETLDKINTRILYTGMSSRAQAQFANVAKLHGAKVVAFHDSLSSYDEAWKIQPFMDEIRYLDEVHVPSRQIGISFKDIAQNKGASVKITGLPVQEANNKRYKDVSSQQLRRTLNIPPKQNVVLFNGGYNQNSLGVLKEFLYTSRQMPETLFIVTLDPRVKGTQEAAAINTIAGNNVHLLHYGNYPDAALYSIASAVIVQNVKDAFDISYYGKPAIFLNTSGSNVQDKRIALQATSQVELVDILSSDKRLMKQASLSKDIPSNADRLILAQILYDLQRMREEE